MYVYFICDDIFRRPTKLPGYMQSSRLSVYPTDFTTSPRTRVAIKNHQFLILYKMTTEACYAIARKVCTVEVMTK